MEFAKRQKRLPGKSRRIVCNVNLAPEVHYALGQIGGGNRSAAIEYLVQQYLRDRAGEAPTIKPN